MLEKTDITITRYKDEGGFYVDVIRNKRDIDACLLHEKRGISLPMFGGSISWWKTEEAFVADVERNLPLHKRHYKKLYLDSDACIELYDKILHPDYGEDEDLRGN